MCGVDQSVTFLSDALRPAAGVGGMEGGGRRFSSGGRGGGDGRLGSGGGQSSFAGPGVFGVRKNVGKPKTPEFSTPLYVISDLSGAGGQELVARLRASDFLKSHLRTVEVKAIPVTPAPGLHLTTRTTADLAQLIGTGQIDAFMQKVRVDCA
jgi:hypothetical protein